MDTPVNQKEKPRRDRGTGSLYQRPGSANWYLKYYRNGLPVRESAKTTDEYKAKKLLQKRLGQLASGNFIGPKLEKVRVDELADDFLRDYRINGKKSLDDVETRWEKHLKPFFGGMRAVQVTTPLIKQYVDERQREGAANATVNREMAALKRMFRLGQQSQKVGSLPHFPHLAENNIRTGFVEDSQYTRLANECSRIGLWLRALLEVGATYGWRKDSELLAMRVKQVDLFSDSPSIRLDPGTTKNKEGREVPLTPAVATLLTPLLVGKQPEDYVFTREDGSPVRDYRTVWQNACCGAGLGNLVCPLCKARAVKVQDGEKDFRCSKCAKEFNRMELGYEGLIVHDLRRTAARNLRRAGVAEGVIMKIGGWKTRSVFERYNIVSHTDVSDALGKLEAHRKNGAQNGAQNPNASQQPKFQQQLGRA